MELRQRFGRMVLVVGLSLTGISFASAKTMIEANREWVRVAVQDQLNQGNLARAIEVLRTYLNEGGNDAESGARLALLQARTLKCVDAQASLERAASEGTASLRSAYRGAADHLRTKGCTAPLAVIPNADASSPATSAWTGAAGLRVGHDSNVMLFDFRSLGRTPESLMPQLNFAAGEVRISTANVRRGRSFISVK